MILSGLGHHRDGRISSPQPDLSPGKMATTPMTQQATVGQGGLSKAGGNLCQNEASAMYYAPVKRRGKQTRRTSRPKRRPFPDGTHSFEMALAMDS